MTMFSDSVDFGYDDEGHQKAYCRLTGEELHLTSAPYFEACQEISWTDKNGRVYYRDPQTLFDMERRRIRRENKHI